MSALTIASAPTAPEAAADFLDTYCARCHNDERLSGDWSLSMVDLDDVTRGQRLDAWEKIYRMTAEGAMPPAHRDQPTGAERSAFTGWLVTQLDQYNSQHPNPGRATLRRLNRVEYSNAVRDLLKVDIDIEDQLPADDSGYGFDNIADVLSVSSTLMDRYLTVAGKVSRLATGTVSTDPVLVTYQVPKDGSILNQGKPAYNERMSQHLPLDSRGGGALSYHAPHDGEYEISGYLNANTNNEVDRLEEARYSHVVNLTAGPHIIGMSFRKQLSLDESVQTLRNTTDIVPLPVAPPESLTLDFVVDGRRVGSVAVPSYHMSERFAQTNFPRDVLQIDVTGPLSVEGPGWTAGQARIFTCKPAWYRSETGCATQILTDIAQQAYRRSVNETDIQPLLALFDSARDNDSFEAAIATAIQAILVSPSFLFLVEESPPGKLPREDYRISDTEFAARMALFLWSSLPDEELLELAMQNRLREPSVLQAQMQRMLKDPRADALTENFAGQWLFLRNLEHHRPDVMMFPDFDVRLRAAIEAESERFFSNLVRENRSVLDLIDADYSFLNDRLARHYGIAGVSGTELRRVDLPENGNRGGILGQASVLTLTSYGNHTSAVKRGQWILDHLLAAPPPPPPPDIPALVMVRDGKPLSARQQMALHREDPACASCHVKMDPLGLSLENYDAIGAYRREDAGMLIDASATLPDGTHFEGLAGLREILLDRKDQFTRAIAEQLLIYGLGRGIEATDRPLVRSIAANAAENEYRIHNILLSILESYQFNYRRVPE
ncbi:MAG: DUF1592 domain-containing protein [Proteobacteria bacterium]|nr:DUF1592 domain-containing protein [Pseudomonadota bacterium]